MVRNPSLRDKPLGIKQKNLMVTCNYVARSLGVKKSMWIKEAIEILPDMIFVDGSDLTHYRQFSAEISAVAHTFTPLVERLGLDENFVDITEVVEDYITSKRTEVEGHIYGDKKPDQVNQGDPCGCGCRKRLIAGTHIARELRQQILETTGITCCAGIAHNKLLAKLVSGYYKPNQQTVIFPWQVHDIMSSLNLTRSIPGIGSVTYRTLEDIGILTVQELQNATISLLKSKFDDETSQRLKDLSFGIDETPVRKSGRPQSIGLEDAFRKVTSIDEVRRKYSTLLERLLKLLADDGRIPASVKVSVRKFDNVKKFGHRETRQVSISSSLFTMGVGKANENTKSSLMTQVMSLFHKMVDTSKNFHLTLIGVAFTKFVERAADDKSISKFFSKRVRENTVDQDSELKREGNRKHCKLSHALTNECIDMECLKVNSSVKNREDRSITVSSDEVNVSEEDILSETCQHSGKLEDDSKKTETVMENANVSDKKNFISSEIDSVKSLNVCDNETDSLASSERDTSLKVPNGIDKEVFNALPRELQDEILHSYSDNSRNTNLKTRKELKSKQSPMKYDSSKNQKIDNFFKPRVSMDLSSSNFLCEKANSKVFLENVSSHEDLKGSEPTCSYSVTESPETLELEICNLKETSSFDSHLPIPGVDPTVFSALPDYVKKEILQEHGLLKQSSTQSKKTPATNRKRDSSCSILKYLKKN
ncbi:DNA polymerase iota-like isoform X2 [Panulirus ornatus]